MLRSPVYIVFFLLTGLLLFLAAGTSLMNAGWLQDFSHRFFHLLCHQFYWRSFSLEQGAMVVCARCFGIYSGMFDGAVILPVILAYWNSWTSRVISIISISFILNVIDFAGNLSGIWTNTLYSRTILGLLFGFSVSALILAALYNQISKKYGTD